MAARNRPGEISVGDRRRSTRSVSIAVAAGRHHSGAGARACHRQGDGARAAAAEGPSDGGQSLRPRRQGHSASGGYFAGEEVSTERGCFLHLSPSGRGRLRSSRVRGLSLYSNRSVLSIISRTPSRLSYTSLFETRTMWKPQASLNLSIPLTRLLRSRPLPGGERYSTANSKL